MSSQLGFQVVNLVEDPRCKGSPLNSSRDFLERMKNHSVRDFLRGLACIRILFKFVRPTPLAVLPMQCNMDLFFDIRDFTRRERGNQRDSDENGWLTVGQPLRTLIGDFGQLLRERF